MFNTKHFRHPHVGKHSHRKSSLIMSLMPSNIFFILVLKYWAQENKRPGNDGLRVEFYKVFWNHVRPFLLNALNCSYTNGHLSITPRRGLITLVPEKNKPANFLKNWRPITLLNCDYKIAAKSIANRVKKVLPQIINNDQRGFLKNRTIRENISLVHG